MLAFLKTDQDGKSTMKQWLMKCESVKSAYQNAAAQPEAGPAICHCRKEQ